MIRIIEALTGRRIAATVLDPADPGEVAALKGQVASLEAEVRRLLGLLGERARQQHDADEQIIQLRAANIRLADRLEALEPADRYGPAAVAR